MTQEEESNKPEEDAVPAPPGMDRGTWLRAGPRIAWLTLGFAVGIALGWNMHPAAVLPWLASGGALALVALPLRSRWPSVAVGVLALAMCSAGVGWITLRHDYVWSNDLASLASPEPMLMRVEGTALSRPELRSRAQGSLARFDYRKPATYFRLAVDTMFDRLGGSTPVRGEVLVRVDETVSPFLPGDRVMATGRLTASQGPRNPGEFDFRSLARAQEQAGYFTVESRELLSVQPATRGDVYSGWLRFRDWLQIQAGASLNANLPSGSSAERDALLSDLLLGQRDPELDGWDDAFQRVGLSHILAISGFHLSVVAGFVLLLVRFGGNYRPWHGWLVIGITLLYLLMVEIRMPVLRAGVMTIVASLGIVGGRRLSVSGLVWLSALPLLLWRPDQLFNAGFQLTYGTVLGLVHLATPLRQRLFSSLPFGPQTTIQLVAEWLKTTTAAGLVAWAVATPIAIFHFGFISPLAAVAGLIAIPLSAVLLILGYLKIVVGIPLPSAGLLLGIPLAYGSEALLWIVRLFDAVPFSVVHVPFPSVFWALACEVWVCSALMGNRSAMLSGRAWRWSHTSGAAALGLWLLWPLLPVHSRPALRIDMISVGDGSCYVLRNDGHTVVFDAGSSTNLNAGTRSIIPALRAPGVRSIDAVAISHANLDHFSAVLELVEEFDIPQVIVTPQILAAAQDDPNGAIAYVVDQLRSRRVQVQSIIAVENRSFGRMNWQWLNPADESRCRMVNDESMVVRVDVDGTGRSVLLCGDIQREAMAKLMGPAGGDPGPLDVDIVELPHHGSHHELAEAFIRQTSPSVVLQSTGRKRLVDDPWAESLSETVRLITARDGACWIEVDADGTIRTGTFLGRKAHDS